MALFFAKKLLGWYQENKRDLPWRKTKNPYYIWISEIILQQTRVNQGMDYYLRFIQNYPQIEDFAKAHLDQILKDWEGLGYYSRARNMHQTAQKILHEYQGHFPQKYKDLLTLKGIGPYTAAAIASIAFEEKIAAVDGNVYRVLSRFYAEKTPIDSTQGQKLFFEYAQALISEENPGDFNQAMMELGATICLPKNPQCSFCPLQGDCKGWKAKNSLDYPIKTKKVKIKQRKFVFFFIHEKENLIIFQQKKQDIWRELFLFPQLEFSEESFEINDFSHFEFLKTALSFAQNPPIKHILTHQHLTIYFLEYFFEKIPEKLKKDFIFIAKDQINNFGFPVPISEFLKEKKIKK